MARSIRPATAADQPALGRLGAQLVRLHHALDPLRFFLVEPLEQGYGRWLVKESANREAVVMVAEVDGAVVGYAYGALVERDWNALLDACGALHDVLVEESQRHAGLATLLVEETCARLKALGAPRVVLSTAAGNAAAQRLFDRLGFRRTMIEFTREEG
jgi:ribosomal protein S18 acetylase RimI-like enzyme